MEELFNKERLDKLITREKALEAKFAEISQQEREFMADLQKPLNRFMELYPENWFVKALCQAIGSYDVYGLTTNLHQIVFEKLTDKTVTGLMVLEELQRPYLYPSKGLKPKAALEA